MFLDRLRAKFIETEIELAFNLVVDAARDADVSRPGYCLKPHGDNHAITEKVAAFDNDITQINPDA
jgi:hypothetical protein